MWIGQWHSWHQSKQAIIAAMHYFSEELHLCNLLKMGSAALKSSWLDCTLFRHTDPSLVCRATEILYEKRSQRGGTDIHRAGWLPTSSPLKLRQDWKTVKYVTSVLFRWHPLHWPALLQPPSPYFSLKKKKKLKSQRDCRPKHYQSVWCSEAYRPTVGTTAEGDDLCLLHCRQWN